MHDRPSTSLLILPGLATDAARELFGQALGRRYMATDKTPPAGFPLEQDEWIGGMLSALPAGTIASEQAALFILEDCSAVFRLAFDFAESHPTLPFLAWRRFRGLPPVLKAYAGGVPVYKNGKDDDLEVGWPIPTDPNEALFTYQDTGLPIRADALDDRLGPALRDYASALASPRSGEQRVAWIRRDSSLA